MLLPVQTVGVMGDGRTYESVCGLRAVTSTDGMTADFFPFPWEVLELRCWNYGDSLLWNYGDSLLNTARVKAARWCRSAVLLGLHGPV